MSGFIFLFWFTECHSGNNLMKLFMAFRKYTSSLYQFFSDQDQACTCNWTEFTPKWPLYKVKYHCTNFTPLFNIWKELCRLQRSQSFCLYSELQILLSLEENSSSLQHLSLGIILKEKKIDFWWKIQGLIFCILL